MITVNGQTSFPASARRARGAMLTQAQLEKFLPKDSAISKVDDQSFDFTVNKDIGITRLKLTGKMTVTPTEDPNALRFQALGNHAFGGTLNLDLILTFTGTEEDCQMSHTGTVDATGLVGKALTLGASKVQGRLDAMFDDFGKRMARHQANHLA